MKIKAYVTHIYRRPTQTSAVESRWSRQSRRVGSDPLIYEIIFYQTLQVETILRKKRPEKTRRRDAKRFEETLLLPAKGTGGFFFFPTIWL